MSKCGDTCEGEKKIVVYPRRLTGWRRCVLTCSHCGEVSRFDFHGKKGHRPAKDSFWDNPVLNCFQASCLIALASVVVVRYARMFSMMDIADFSVWCFMWGGVAILAYGCARE